MRLDIEPLRAQIFQTGLVSLRRGFFNGTRRRSRRRRTKERLGVADGNVILAVESISAKKDALPRPLDNPLLNRLLRRSRAFREVASAELVHAHS